MKKRKIKKTNKQNKQTKTKKIKKQQTKALEKLEQGREGFSCSYFLIVFGAVLPQVCAARSSHAPVAFLYEKNHAETRD